MIGGTRQQSAPVLRQRQHGRRVQKWDCLSFSLLACLATIILAYVHVLMIIMSPSVETPSEPLISNQRFPGGAIPYEKEKALQLAGILRKYKDQEIDESSLQYPLLSIRKDILGMEAKQEEKDEETPDKMEARERKEERDREAYKNEYMSDEELEGDAQEAMNHVNEEAAPSPKESDHILRAYLEPIFQEDWEIKPLPVRNTTADQLKEISYPGVTSCSKLIEQFPADDYPDDDPFLPWIHDVFPTHDGKFIQFIAQNRRRCDTGKKNDGDILKHRQPQAALFQHVPVKRLGGGRYRLSTHDEADPDGVATRFICRFKPSGQETLSVHNVNYEYAAYRKLNHQLFTKEGYNLKSIYTSQLLFQCPVPESLQTIVKEGSSVVNDYATLFVDLIPIRTPPRYGAPNEFLPPRYKEHESVTEALDATAEFGDNHVLPLIKDSGRWENLPICKPSLMEYEPSALKNNQDDEEKNYRLIACVWASAAYTTRGERFSINDGQRRLKEWLTFNFMVGFDHIYVYDNSLAHTDTTSLKPVTDLFADKVTRVVWPAKVCNNRPNNVDSPGERSSQYAAEASCKLRFGTHAEWLGGFDIDEYLVPMGDHTSVLSILDKLEEEKTKIISFGSWRAWPRKKYLEEPVVINSLQECGRNKPCFEVRVQSNHTILQTYNCDRQKGQKKKVMPAEKQLYKPDYVKLHFVHYSTITELAQMSKTETEQAGLKWLMRINQDPASRFSDEVNEATMLHTKAVATKDTAGWLEACKHNQGFCRIGNPFPPGAFEANITEDKDGWSYTCFVNERIDDYWVPRLEAADPFLPAQ